jgi:hypothetical protein
VAVSIRWAIYHQRHGLGFGGGVVEVDFFWGCQ